MSLNDEGLTLEQLDKNVKQRLAQDHFHNIIEAIQWHLITAAAKSRYVIGRPTNAEC